MNPQKKRQHRTGSIAKIMFAVMLANMSVSLVLATPGPQWPTPVGAAELTVADARDQGDSPVEQNTSRIVRTTDGKFVIVWADKRGDDYEIYGEKIDTAGNIKWNILNPGKGLLIATSNGDDPAENLFVAADTSNGNSGGVFISWDSNRDSTQKILVTKLDTDGIIVSGWTNNGNILDSGSDYSASGVMADGNGGAYVAWQTPGTGGGRALKLAKIQSGDGTISETFNSGTALGIDTQIAVTSQVKMVASSSGSVILGYGDSASYAVNRITATGTFAWAGSTNFDSYDPSPDFDMVTDKNYGVILTYKTGSGSNSNIEVQRIDATGSLLWNSGGMTVCDSSGTQETPVITTDNVLPDGGAIIAWEDKRSGTEFDIYTQRINHEGIAQWTTNGLAISSTSDSLDQTKPAIASNGNNGAIITFASEINGFDETRLKAQHITGAGIDLWQPGGMNISDGSRYDTNPSIAGDGNGGAVIAWDGTDQWTDGGTTPWLYDIFTQYVRDPTSGPIACQGMTENQFCAKQQIVQQILTLTEIPDSFGFSDIILNGSTVERFNNSTATPHLDDIIGVQDTRLQGGFVVQVQASGNFVNTENSTQEIDLSDCNAAQPVDKTSCLYIVTSTTSGYTIPGAPETLNGVIYEPSGQSEMNITADINAEGNNLSLPETYINYGEDLGNRNVVDLMTGTLSTSTGRNGKFYQYVSYYLKIPGLPSPQPEAGNYAITFTFTLMESNL